MNEHTCLANYLRSGNDNLLSQLNYLSYLLEHICKFITEEILPIDENILKSSEHTLKVFELFL